MVNLKCFTALLTLSVLTTAAPAPAADAEEGKLAPRQTGELFTPATTRTGAPLANPFGLKLANAVRNPPLSHIWTTQSAASINNHLVNVPSDWNDVISSIRNQAAWSCTWYE